MLFALSVLGREIDADDDLLRVDLPKSPLNGRFKVATILERIETSGELWCLLFLLTSC